MAELVALGAEVPCVLGVLRLDDGHALLDAEPIPLEPHDLARVVRDGTDGVEPEIEQDLRADAVVAEIRRDAELLVGLDGVCSTVLKLICLELVEEADAPALLIEIHDDAAPLGLNHLHGGLELPSAVAAHRVKHVARETLRVHAHERALAVADVAIHQRDVLVRVDVVAIADDAPRAILRRKPRLRNAVDEAFRLQPMRNKLRHGDERQPVLCSDFLELRTTRGAAVLVQDLADDAGRIDAGQTREIHRGLRVPHTLKHGDASTLTVYAVRYSSMLLSAIIGSSSWSARSPVSARQMRPPARLIMKLIVAGVTSCAAQTRSPSFSRFSSSATMTSFPAAISAIACSTVLNGMLRMTTGMPRPAAARTCRACLPRRERECPPRDPKGWYDAP